MSAAENNLTFALISRRVVLPEGIRQAAVLVAGERIAGIVDPADVPSKVPRHDIGDLIVAPGVIDAHVHINEPGRTEWEGFETATRAAAAGGITTLVDMPLNSNPVTTNVAALKEKRRAAAGKCLVDVGFYGGLIPGNAKDIEPLLDAGVLGIKAFLCDSGLPEFPPATLADLQAAAPILARHDCPLLVHAELANHPAPVPVDVCRYSEYLASRPPEWERDAIALLIDLCRATRCPTHLVHLANGDALAMLEAARGEGLPITVETCPHYLHLLAEDIARGDTRFKCAPPIRDRRHAVLLWQGLQNGTIDTIGSDHSPCPPVMKRLEAGDFAAAWGGISSLQLTLSLVWTEALLRGIDAAVIFRWLSAAPARLLRLSNKGRLAAGCDADLVVFDPTAQWTVSGAELHHRHKLTPYEGETLQGRLLRTYVRGKLVFDDGRLISESVGQLLSVAEKRGVRMSLAEHLNRLDAATLRQALERCCASRAWIAAMERCRPFADDQAMLAAATEQWWKLTGDDWREAFAAHPQIGDLASLKAKYANTQTWAGGEQAGVAAASDATLERLSELNREYRERFGYIFIVCATGKSADEMLAILQQRLPNAAEAELRIAAAEQLKITLLRLQKLTP